MSAAFPDTSILKYVRVLDTTIKDMFNGDHDDRQAYLAQLEADEKAHLDGLIQESIEEQLEQEDRAAEPGTALRWLSDYDHEPESYADWRWRSRYQVGRFGRG